MTAPLSILHVNLSHDFGGTERYCADLAARQIAQGHRVSLAAWRARCGQKDAVQNHAPHGTAVYLAWRGFARCAIARAIAEQAVDIINVHLPASAAAVQKLRMRPPAVMTQHLHFNPREARRMAGLICVAEWQQAALRAFAGPVAIARNWAPKRRAVSGEEVRSLRARLNAGPDTTVVGFVGRLEPVKGACRLIRAYRKWAGKDTRLVLIGDGRERARLAALAADDPTICFAGHSNTVDAWYGALDLLVLPSAWEGLPLVLLEAMQAGVPILASRSAGTSEVLAGSPAVTVEQSEDALTAALGQAMARARNNGRSRPAYDLSAFSAEKSVARIEDFYREVMTMRACRQSG